jgi:hypothetical protein
MIEERWLEVYDGAMMSPTDRWEEEEEQAPRMPPTIAVERNPTQWHDMEPMSMSPSFDAVFEPVSSNGDPSFNENIKALSSTPKNSSSSGNIPQTNKALGDRVL